jgi:hypothetical protein
MTNALTAIPNCRSKIGTKDTGCGSNDCIAARQAVNDPPYTTASSIIDVADNCAFSAGATCRLSAPAAIQTIQNGRRATQRRHAIEVIWRVLHQRGL